MRFSSIFAAIVFINLRLVEGQTSAPVHKPVKVHRRLQVTPTTPIPILKIYYSMDGGKTFKTNLVTVAPPMYLSYDLKGQPQVTFSLAQLSKIVCTTGDMVLYAPATTGPILRK